MKKLIKTFAVITSMACMFSQVSGFAEGNDKAASQRTEISFRIGDDTLVINGKDTKVEKPYVVGEGVTLVPLRVITEAFGAAVEWNGGDKSIKLTYPDVDIRLQIDNPIAEVNSKAEKLLSAPELTEQGYTMVPLRFISETFGATVDWDSETQSVLVIKDNVDEAAVELEGTISEKNIGDSYYKWTMENPQNMYMDKRSFDGRYTSFVYDDKNKIAISIRTRNKDYDFEKDFTDQKDKLKSFTLVRADKDAENSIKTMHFQARDKDLFIDLKYYVTNDYLIDVVGNFENEKTEIKDEALRIMDTFVIGFTGKDTYDLSNVKNDARKFEPENLNFSVLIPKEYYLGSDEDSPNEFTFVKSGKDGLESTVSIALYSKSDVISAKALAEKDYDFNKSISNESIYTFTDPKYNAYRNFKAVEYSYTEKGGKHKDHYTRDVFFEKGDYVYNVCVATASLGAEGEQRATEIFNSIEADEPDAEKVGILMRNDYDRTGTYTAKGNGWTMTMPNSVKEISSSSDGAVYGDASSYVTIQYSRLNSINNSEDIRQILRNVAKDYDSTTGKTIVSDYDTKNIGKWFCSTFTYTTETEDDLFYTEAYAFSCNGHAILFVVNYPERAYSEGNKKMVREIIGSYAE